MYIGAAYAYTNCACKLCILTLHIDGTAQVYVEGLGAKHVRGVYPLIGLANLEAQRPEEQKDYDMMVRLAEQVVSIRKQLGEDAPMYKQSVDLLHKFKRERFTKTTAAGRIARLWKKLTAARETGTASKGADGAVNDTDSVVSGDEHEDDRNSGGGGGDRKGGRRTPAQMEAQKPEAAPAGWGQQPFPHTHSASQPQMQMPQPYMQPPPMYYPAPAAPAPAAAAPPQEVLEFISKMTTRIAALETKSDAFTERLMAAKDEQHQLALANAIAAASAKLPLPPPETSSAQLEALQERLHAMHSTGVYMCPPLSPTLSPPYNTDR